MPITYDIDTEAGKLFVNWHGKITLEEITRHWNTLLNDGKIPMVARVLTDLRDSTILFTGAEFWRTIDNHYRETLGLKTVIVAILVANEEQEKLARIWKSLAPKTVTVNIFSARNQAYAWLSGDPDSASED
jgi:hypothetical protein